MREVHWILGGLLVSLLLASLIAYGLTRRRPVSPAVENLNARIRSWWVLVLVGGGALLAGRIAILLLFGLVSFLALREFLPGGGAARWICLYLIPPVQYGLIGLGWHELFSILMPVGGSLALAVTAVMFDDRIRNRTARVFGGVMLCVYCLSHIPALAMVGIPGHEDRAPLLMVFVVLIAQVSDIFQYIWGKLLGRHLVAVMVSPAKTVEGLVGGVLSATLLGGLLWPITPFSMWQAGWMAFLISVLGFVGGLAMSAIKRDRGIKDWGTLLPGHGGILDRIDSLCFSAPVCLYLVRYRFGWLE